MKNVKVIKKAAIFLMVFVLAFSSLSAAAQLLTAEAVKEFVILVQVTKCIIIVKE